MINYQLHAWRDRPDADIPLQTNQPVIRRPHGTDGKDEAEAALERALVGQVVRLDKKVIRAHYESLAAVRRGEVGVCA